jgi:hypothetical protein
VLRWLSVLVFALALVAAGCGGSDQESAVPDETMIEVTTSPDTTSPDTASKATSDSDLDLTGVLDDEDCQALSSVTGMMAQAASGTLDDESAAVLAGLAIEVFYEVGLDIDLLAGWALDSTAELEDVADELQGIGFEPGQPLTADRVAALDAALPAALAGTDWEELLKGLEAVSQRLDAWSQANCNG